MTNIVLKNVSKKYTIHPFSLNHAPSSLREEVIRFTNFPKIAGSVFLSYLHNKLSKRSFQQHFFSLFFVLKKVSRSSLKHVKIPIQKNKSHRQDHWALKDISISFTQGDIIGIVGKNGSGKSTLLKVISGITPPTTGEIHVNGRVTTLLGNGIGFHTELSGKENIYLSGAILGFRKKALDIDFHNIIRFSGVEKFIHTPIKFYSSGMYARLAFSIATSFANTADIFLFDEVFAVGDEEFKQKSLERIRDLSSDKKRIILLVSHDIYVLENICTKCIWLENGKIKAYGQPKEILKIYMKTMKR